MTHNKKTSTVIMADLLLLIALILSACMPLTLPLSERVSDDVPSFEVGSTDASEHGVGNRTLFDPFFSESVYTVTYPESGDSTDATDTPYVLAYPSPDGNGVLLRGSGQEGAVIRVKGGDEICAVKIRGNAFRMVVPVEGEFRLEVTAKTQGLTRSAAVTVEGNMADRHADAKEDTAV